MFVLFDGCVCDSKALRGNKRVSAKNVHSRIVYALRWDAHTHNDMKSRPHGYHIHIPLYTVFDYEHHRAAVYIST